MNTTSRVSAVVLAAALLLPAAVNAAPDRQGLGRALATKLSAEKALRPETHATDFAGDDLGCITLTAWELRNFGYRGHAFLCEATASGEVLGAVLNRAGQVRCYITGHYSADFCYTLNICGIPDTGCVQ